jgi:phospholipid transport system substrate-binding protein
MFHPKTFPQACRQLLAVIAITLGMTHAGASQEISPLDLVRDTSSRMLVALHDERETIAGDSERLYELVADIVLPYFDFRRMSQWVLSSNWRTASAEQRECFVEQFRILLVRTYGKALAGYADEKIIYLPFAAAKDAPTVTVRTEIEQADSPIPISYSLYRSDTGWKVYDVAISGVSLVTNYRSSFGNIIRREGMDSLIRQLTDRNNEQTGG